MQSRNHRLDILADTLRTDSHSVYTPTPFPHSTPQIAQSYLDRRKSEADY